MNAIITGVATTVVTIVSLAAPAGATNSFGFSMAGNSSLSGSGYAVMGIGPNGPYIQGQQVYCSSVNMNMAGSMSFGNASTTPAVTSGSTATGNGCSAAQATQTVNNPPADSTVTINGVCGDPAELAKIKAEHANVIINSIGACPTDNGNGTPVATTPVTVVVTPNAPTPTATTASVTTPVAATDNGKGVVTAALPKTGIDGIAVSAATTVLAVAAYAGTMVVRTLRNRA